MFTEYIRNETGANKESTNLCSTPTFFFFLFHILSLSIVRALVQTWIILPQLLIQAVMESPKAFFFWFTIHTLYIYIYFLLKLAS